MNKNSKICIIKCKEKDLIHNLSLLYNKQAKLVAVGSAIIGKGKYFYLPLANADEVKDLDIKGKLIME